MPEFQYHRLADCPTGISVSVENHMRLGRRPEGSQALISKFHQGITGTIMNYRHIYHAGNFADVLKHAVLAHDQFLKTRPGHKMAGKRPVLTPNPFAMARR